MAGQVQRQRVLPRQPIPGQWWRSQQRPWLYDVSKKCSEGGDVCFESRDGRWRFWMPFYANTTEFRHDV